jgi:TetR/AcrR family transcriptional repressor of nem operon
MGRPRKLDDDTLLDQAIDLFWRDGCDAVSIRDLEVALDIKAPSIYRRFPTRDDLVAACVDRYVEQIVRRRVDRYLIGAADPLRGLRKFFTTTLAPHPGETSPRGCLLTTTAGQHAGDVSVVRTALQRGFDVIRDGLRDALRRAQTQGQIADRIDCDITAASLLLSFEGLLVLARSGAPGLRAAIDTTLATHCPEP